MPVFVQLACMLSKIGVINVEKDTGTLNKILAYLQEKGARIIDVKIFAWLSSAGYTIVYLITYEASSPIECKV